MVVRRAMILIAAAIPLVSASAQSLIVGEKSHLDQVLVRDADLIVVGTLRPMISYLWFDGIHVGGTIAVAEVLYGTSSTDKSLALRMVTPWPDLYMLTSGRGFQTRGGTRSIPSSSLASGS